VILALICGAVFGGGLLLIVGGLYPPRPSLADALAQLRTVPERAPLVAHGVDGGFAARFARPVADILGRRNSAWFIRPRVRRDLAVLDRLPRRATARRQESIEPSLRGLDPR
jgi:hypothetical protein